MEHSQLNTATHSRPLNSSGGSIIQDDPSKASSTASAEPSFQGEAINSVRHATPHIQASEAPLEMAGEVRIAPTADSTSHPAVALLNAIWLAPELQHQLGSLDRRTSQFRNHPVSTIESALAEARALSSAGQDAYFACAEYITPTSRKAENAAGACAFWMDFDVGELKDAAGKGYATTAQVYEGLRIFVERTRLPAPTHVVDSGGGLHVYWSVGQHVPRETWQAHASKLKALAEAVGLRADPSRTSDIASVLRVPGTLNYKYTPAKSVRLIEAASEPLNRDTLLACIAGAHDRLCDMPAPTPSQSLAANDSGVDWSLQSFGPVDLAKLTSALSVLDPDCDDGTWKLRRLAPLAGAARAHPDFAEDLKNLARRWSRGDLTGEPSKAWVTPGTSNGLTGAQAFDAAWDRFLKASPQPAQTTIGTIFHDAKLAGWTGGREVVQLADGESRATLTGRAVKRDEPAFVRISDGLHPDSSLLESWDMPSRYALDKAKPLDVSTFPHPPRKGSNAPPATIPNVEFLLQQYGITARYNIIKKKLLVTMPGHYGSADNFDSVAITQINSLALLNGMQLGQIPGSVEAIGDRNLFNPVADWILGRPWDGVDRLPAIYATLHEREGFPRPLKEALVRRWLLSSVAAALSPYGFSCRGVLTLQGPQGIGKTKWTSALVSDSALANRVIKLGHHLDPGDKDSQVSALTHWIVEIGELDGSLKKDIARLKGFLTLSQDKIRRPYGKADSEYPRKTVFCASVNDSSFLVDMTGNSRWWTVPVVGIDYEHAIDMQQLFAQLVLEYRNGEQWWLTPDEEQSLAAQNKSHRTESVVRERVLAIMDLDPESDVAPTALTATEVLKRASMDHPTNPQLKECCGVLRELYGESKRVRGRDKWPVRLLADTTLSL